MKYPVVERFFFVVSGVFFLYTASLGLNSFFRYNEFKKEYNVKSKRFSMLQLKHQKMSQMLSSLENDSYWIDLSRRHLHMVFPNETMFRFYYKESQ